MAIEQDLRGYTRGQADVDRFCGPIALDHLPAVSSWWDLTGHRQRFTEPRVVAFPQLATGPVLMFVNPAETDHYKELPDFRAAFAAAMRARGISAMPYASAEEDPGAQFTVVANRAWIFAADLRDILALLGVTHVRFATRTCKHDALTSPLERPLLHIRLTARLNHNPPEPPLIRTTNCMQP